MAPGEAAVRRSSRIQPRRGSQAAAEEAARSRDACSRRVGSAVGQRSARCRGGNTARRARAPAIIGSRLGALQRRLVPRTPLCRAPAAPWSAAAARGSGPALNTTHPLLPPSSHPSSEPPAGALPPELWARVVALADPAEAALTLTRVSAAWREAAAPVAAKLRAAEARLRDERTDPLKRWLPRPAPLWALQEAWPRLGTTRREFAAERAAFRGDAAALRWALEHTDPWHGPAAFRRVCAAAADGGQVEALQCAQAYGCPWDAGHSNCCTSAAARGDLPMLQWARAQEPPCPWDVQGCLRSAKKKKRRLVAEWIQAQAQ